MTIEYSKQIILKLFLLADVKKRKATSMVTPSTSTNNANTAAVALGPPSEKSSATGVSECKKDEDSSDEEPTKCGMFM